MRFDTKIAIVVRENLPVWQRLNVTAFVSSGIAAGVTDIIGKPYEDGVGRRYLAMIRQPMLVFAADAGQLAGVHARAVARDLPTALYTEDMFATDNDDANRAVVRDAPPEELPLVGLAVHGPRNVVDKVVKGLSLHG